MATQTKNHLKPTFTFTPLEVGRLGRPSRLRRAVLMGLSHFLTSKGFTLIEILIALVILSMGIAMLITMFTVGMKGVIANQARTQATNLAQDLMDEIVGKEFRDPTQTPGWGIESGETQGDRTTYDDVDDYSAWKNYNPPEDIGGNALNLYANFTRSVSVARVNPADLQAPLSDGNPTHVSCYRIIVYVEHSDIATVSLYGLKTLSVY